MAAQKLGTLGILDILLAGDTANLKRATKEGATNLEKMGAVARSTATSIAKLSAAIGAAGAAVLAFANRQARLGDETAKTARRLGLTTEALSELRHAAELSTVKIATFDMAMQRFGRRTAEAAKGTGEAEAALKELGIELLDGNGRLKSSDVLLGEVADAMGGVGTESDKVRLAMKLFDSEGVQLLNMLSRGKAGLDEMRQAARDAGNVWSTEASAAAERFTTNLAQLKGMAEGLAIQIGGPLVRSLADVAKAFLDAQRAGESFGTALLRATQVFLTGTDAQKWEKDMAAAGDDLMRAQKRLDEALRVSKVPGMRAWGEQMAAEARAAVEGAQAEIARLRDIKPVLLGPEVPPAEGGTGTPTTPGMTDAEMKAEEERKKLLGEQFQWEIDEEQRVLEEIGAIHIAAHEKRLEDEKQRQADLMAAKIAGYDWEQEQAIAQGEDLLAIDKAIAEQKRAQREREKQANANFWDNLAGLMNTGSKKVFEIGKAFSLGQAAIKGASAVMSAWEAGMSVGGPWAPAVAAAYAAAAGLNALNLMNNIRSQQFGGGGGAPIAPSQGASGISPVGAGGGGQQRERPSMHTTVVLPAADLTSTAAVRQLLLGFVEEIEANGGRLSIQG